MAELDTSGLRSGLRVVRTVRRAQFAGRASGEAVAGSGLADTGSLAASALSLAVTGAEFPELAIALGGLVAVGALAQFYQPNLGAIVLPDNVHRPWEYADKIRRLLLEKLYGFQEGDRVWNAEWSHRTIEIDLRVKVP